MLQTILLLPPPNENQRSVNDFWHCMIENPEAFDATLTHNWSTTRLFGENIVVTTSGLCPNHEHRWSVNYFWSGIMENARAAWRHWTIIEQSSAFQCQNDCDNFATMSYIWVSTERQRLLTLQLGKCKGCAATLTHNQTISRLSGQNCWWPERNHVPKSASTEYQQSVNDFWSCILDNLTAMERR